MKPLTQYRLLYVDDNADDVLFFQEAARTAAPSLVVDCVSGPAAAVDYLDDFAEIAEHQPYTGPALVLLDYHFRNQGGPCLTAWIRAHPCYKALPIVIFTGADAPAQIVTCYRDGANHFVMKPAREIFARLAVIIHALYEYMASTPPNCELLEKLTEYRPAPVAARGYKIRAAVIPWMRQDRSAPPA